MDDQANQQEQAQQSSELPSDGNNVVEGVQDTGSAEQATSDQQTQTGSQETNTPEQQSQMSSDQTANVGEQQGQTQSPEQQSQTAGGETQTNAS